MTVDPEARTELSVTLLFGGEVERARAAGDQLEAGGWRVTVMGQLVEAKRRVAWKDLAAAREQAEAVADRLGADDFAYEVALPET